LNSENTRLEKLKDSESTMNGWTWQRKMEQPSACLQYQPNNEGENERDNDKLRKSCFFDEGLDTSAFVYIDVERDQSKEQLEQTQIEGGSGSSNLSEKFGVLTGTDFFTIFRLSI